MPYKASKTLSTNHSQVALPARAHGAGGTLRGILKLLLFALLVAELLGFNLKLDGTSFPDSSQPFYSRDRPAVETASNPCTWVDVKGPGGAHFLQCMTP